MVIPQEMQAAVLRAPGVEGLKLETRPVPDPEPGEVLVRVRACGIGGTVLRKVRGLSPDQLPLVPGHEITGDIAAVSDGVRDARVGDRVLVYTYVTCGRCHACWRDLAPLCTRSPNYSAWESGDHWDGGFRIGEDRDGGFAEYVSVPVRNAIPLPAGVGYVEATTAVDAIATSLHVSRLARLAAGERIAVVGAAGGLGVHLLQVARWFGAEPVAIDLPEKLGRLAEYGAVELIDASSDDWSKELRSTVDVAVDFVGNRATLGSSLATLNSRGRLVIMTPDVGVDFPIATRWMVAGERMIQGSKAHSHAEVQEGARLLISGTVRPVISKSVSLDGVPSVLRDLQEGQFVARGAMAID